jgi:predicted permease
LRIVGAGGTATHAATGYLLTVKLLLVPLVAVAMARALGLGGIHADVAVVFAALPPASSAYILAQRMGGDGPQVAWLVSLGTLLAMLSLPVLLLLR